MPINSEVDEWFEAYDNPMKDVVQAVRSVILEDERITETIKWKSPTFVYVPVTRGSLMVSSHSMT